MKFKIKKVLLTAEMKKDENGKSISGNTDVIVQLDNGSKYIASFFSYDYIKDVRDKNIKTGAFAKGKYFWDKHMVLVEECSLKVINPVINEIVNEGEFFNVFSLL